MDASTLLRFAAAFGLVLGLILLLGWGLRRFGPMAGLATPTHRGPRRIALIEAMQLDPRHRLVLVRCDQQEHLLLLGAAGALELRAGAAVAPASATIVRERA